MTQIRSLLSTLNNLGSDIYRIVFSYVLLFLNILGALCELKSSEVLKVLFKISPNSIYVFNFQDFGLPPPIWTLDKARLFPRRFINK